MIKLTLPLCAAMVALPLAACNHKPEVVDTTSPDPLNDALQNAAPVELPPAVSASKSFRCSDNSLVYVDFFSDGKQVTFRETEGADPTLLKSDNKGGPWSNGTYTVSGTPSSITYSRGDKSLSCKA